MELALGTTQHDAKDGERPTCGKGADLSQGFTQQPPWCSAHGYWCWERMPAVELIQTAMIVQAILDGEPESDTSNPPPDWVDAVEFLLGCDYDCKYGDEPVEETVEDALERAKRSAAS